ncbi:imidazolonepropionase [Glycocaulis sp.]|uniref:imidazolonepropionase n=1 Tax=Glycocaulis sp. TaxID=1969725 RepID=UPI00345B844A
MLTQARIWTGLGPDLSPGAIVIEGGEIAWVGHVSELPDRWIEAPRQGVSGRLITPALIDCHTHLVHAGHRAREFEMRLKGASYADIARAGGGILSTVAATRAASEDELVEAALPRLDALLAEGVGVVEIKSGYGLDIETELKMLRAAGRLQTLRPVRVRTSFLGAHAIPPEYKYNSAAYIKEMVIPALRAAHEEGLVDAVDGFVESIAFSANEMEEVFNLALTLGLPAKIHAEQLSWQGGTAMAARHGAMSADHLEYADENDVKAMAEAGMTAVLLPGAFYFLRETKLPPIKALREFGVPIALATDCNPGSSPLTSLLLAMNMSCTLFQLTVEEALRGVTINAAKALNLSDCGVIAPGYRADLAVWDVESPAELCYRVGFNPLHQRYFGGRPC